MTKDQPKDRRSAQGPAQGPQVSSRELDILFFYSEVIPILFSAALNVSWVSVQHSLTLWSQHLSSKHMNVLTWPQLLLTGSLPANVDSTPFLFKDETKALFFYSNRFKNIFQVVISITVLDLEIMI